MNFSDQTMDEIKKALSECSVRLAQATGWDVTKCGFSCAVSGSGSTELGTYINLTEPSVQPDVITGKII